MTRFDAASGDSRTLEYDEAGRIAYIRHSADETLTHALTYDKLDRIRTWVRGASRREYNYDINGNREDLTIGVANHDYAVSPTSNRLLSTAGPSPARTFAYDNAGNTQSDGQILYTYDDRGRMVEATKGTATTKYAHDGLGQRIRKSGTGTTYFTYDEGGHLIGTYDTSGNVIQEFVYVGDMPIAVLSTAGTGPNANQMVHYIHTDQVMKPWSVTDANGILVWKWDSPPFGEGSPSQNPTGTTGTFTFNLRFPGQHYDKETGLFYNYFRDYDPQTGRYVQSDPIGLEGGLNSYLYVEGNPLSLFDAFGLESFGDCVGRRRWDWGAFGASESGGTSTVGNVASGANVANAVANQAVGSTTSGIGAAPHPTTWQHVAGSEIGQTLQQSQNGRSFGRTQANWSSAGRWLGRLAIMPTIWEGAWDIGSMVYCGCSAR